MSAGTYSSSDIKKGLKLEIDGYPWSIVDFQFVKPGKGQAFNRIRMKNLITGQVVERTYKIVESFQVADVEEVQMEFLYHDGDGYNFMNQESFEQVAIQKDVVGDSANFLLENMKCAVLFYKGRPVSLELPNFVELEITYCEPGVKGNTATGTTKNATVSTGAQVAVPLFIEQGETIKVDTRTGDYVERVRR